MSLRKWSDERSLELVGTGEELVLKISDPTPPSLNTHRASCTRTSVAVTDYPYCLCWGAYCYRFPLWEPSKPPTPTAHGSHVTHRIARSVCGSVLSSHRRGDTDDHPGYHRLLSFQSDRTAPRDDVCPAVATINHLLVVDSCSHYCPAIFNRLQLAARSVTPLATLLSADGGGSGLIEQRV